MESIVISQKKLRAIVFKSFFALRRDIDAVINPNNEGFTLRKFKPGSGDVLTSHQFTPHYPEKEHYYYDHGDPWNSLNWDDLLRLFMTELEIFENKNKVN